MPTAAPPAAVLDPLLASPTASCDLTLLVSMAEGLAVAAAEHPADGNGQRSYRCLLATDTYDAWLIHWPPGTGLPAHDHGGSAGAFTVVTGTLEEDVRTAGRPGRRRVAPGTSVSFGADHVHAVRNRGEVPATSIHVYSPPVGVMAFFE